MSRRCHAIRRRTFLVLAACSIFVSQGVCHSTIRTSSASLSVNSSPIDYFQERWRNKSSTSATAQYLGFVQIPTQTTHDSHPANSLSVRGGGGIGVEQRATKVDLSSTSLRTFWSDADNSLLKYTAESYAIQRQLSDMIIQQQLNDIHEHSNIYYRQITGRLKKSSSPKISDIYDTIRRRSRTDSFTNKVAFKLSQTIFFAGTHLEAAWSDAFPHVLRWFNQGRQDQGLFRLDTWKVSSTEDRLILQQAWDRQFKTKQSQLILGSFVGLVTSPVASVAIGSTVLIACAVEINHILRPAARHFVSQHNMNKFLPAAIASMWKRLDSSFESTHANMVYVIQHPNEIIHNVKQYLRLDSLIPQTVLRGILVGVLLGSLSRS